MYSVRRSSKFKKDIRKLQKQNKDISKFQDLHEYLVNGKALPHHYRDHELIGNWSGLRECHIEPDWLVIYRVDPDEQLLEYARTGSHSELFS